MRMAVSIALMSLCTAGMAQNEVDALRYSQVMFGGTARVLGMAGASGAIGGDLSVLYINPAGIAVFRKSEISFTPALHSFLSTSVYNGTASFDNKVNFNFANAGIVLTYKKGDDEEYGWISTHFGFTYHRIRNFHTSVMSEGPNASGSLLDVFLGQVNAGGGTNPDVLYDRYPSSAWLAFQTYLIDTVPGSPTYYFSQVPFGGIKQRRETETRGAIGESVFTFGANYGNRLYLGASLAFPSIRYTEHSNYSESDHMDTIPVFSSYTLEQDLRTQGYGVNAKLGFLYRISDYVRAGMSLHTPTVYSMTDNYSSNIAAEYDDGKIFTERTPDGIFDYSLTTPLRVTASLALILQKAGLVNLDYEFVDYSKAHLGSSTYSFPDENKAADNKYSSAGNLRVGTEWRLDPFRIRAGYAFYGSPFSGQVNNDGSMESYAAGFGIRENNTYVDFAYVLTQTNEHSYFYSPDLVNPAANHLRYHNFAVTFGFRY